MALTIKESVKGADVLINGVAISIVQSERSGEGAKAVKRGKYILAPGLREWIRSFDRKQPSRLIAVELRTPSQDKKGQAKLKALPPG